MLEAKTKIKTQFCFFIVNFQHFTFAAQSQYFFVGLNFSPGGQDFSKRFPRAHSMNLLQSLGSGYVPSGTLLQETGNKIKD